MSQKRKDLQVTKVVSGLAKMKKKAKEETKAAEQQKALAPKPEEIKSLKEETKLVKEAIKKPGREPKPPKEDKPELLYVESIMIKGEEFSIGDLAKDMKLRFQVARHYVHRVAAMHGRKLIQVKRGCWKLEEKK